jgi:hypothetical protein
LPSSRFSRPNTHESFDHPPVEAGSEASFGYVVAGAFAIIALLPLRHALAPHWWALAVAAALALVARFGPAVLRPANIVWFRLGTMLDRMLNPVVISVLFFVLITPAGIIARWLGKDFLKLTFDRSTPSYWISRDPPGPKPDSMNRQF